LNSRLDNVDVLSQNVNTLLLAVGLLYNTNLIIPILKVVVPQTFLQYLSMYDRCAATSKKVYSIPIYYFSLSCVMSDCRLSDS
jgi:hypothetical protein